MSNAIINTIEELYNAHHGKYFIQINGEDVLWVYDSQKSFVEDLHGHSATVVAVSREVVDELDDHGWIGVEGESAVDAAESLEDLMAIFEAELHSGIELIDNREMTALPTFYTHTSPAGNHTEVWSWNDTHALVGAGAGDMQVVRYVNGEDILEDIVSATDAEQEVTVDYVDEYVFNAWGLCIDQDYAQDIADAFRAWKDLVEAGKATAGEWDHICKPLDFAVYG